MSECTIGATVLSGFPPVGDFNIGTKVNSLIV